MSDDSKKLLELARTDLAEAYVFAFDAFCVERLVILYQYCPTLTRDLLDLLGSPEELNAFRAHPALVHDRILREMTIVPVYSDNDVVRRRVKAWCATYGMPGGLVFIGRGFKM